MRIVKFDEALTIWGKYAQHPFGTRVKHVWREAWLRNPSMTVLVVFTPIFIVQYALELAFRDRTRGMGKKYDKNYRLYRPDDPLVAQLKHYSRLD